MAETTVTRRNLVRGGGVLAGLTVLQQSGSGAARAGADATAVHVDDLHETYPGRPGDVVLPWVDQPDPVPPPAQDVVGNLLDWEALSTRLTPADDFFTVKHYGQPVVDPATWRLEVTGLVDRPLSLSLPELQARRRRQVEYTLECSGNTGLPFFAGGVGNAVWGGTALASVLRRARPTEEAAEVVFWGADSGTVTVRDNSGITGAGSTGVGVPDEGGGLDLTVTEHFARSMSLEEAMTPSNLLCDEMNGGPLPAEHGAPVRLIAPGWYGVANVKWLTRIEVTSQRFAGRFMARDYVTVRERTDATGVTSWTFSTVGHDRLKSAPAKVVRNGSHHRVIGVAWGDPVARVEVRVDGGPWRAAEVAGDRRDPSGGAAWRFWSLDWGRPGTGEHTITSRAVSRDGEVQPAPDDPRVAERRTYWEANGQITRTVVI